MGHLPFAAGMKTQEDFGYAFTPELMAKHNIVGQGLGAEMIADQWEISRAELDELAVRSHRLAHQATEEGRFEREIVPMSVDGETLVTDQGIRPKRASRRSPSSSRRSSRTARSRRATPPRSQTARRPCC